MPDQQFEQGMHLTRMHKMIIIQHQDDILGHIGQIVDEQGGHLIW